MFLNIPRKEIRRAKKMEIFVQKVVVVEYMHIIKIDNPAPHAQKILEWRKEFSASKKCSMTQ